MKTLIIQKQIRRIENAIITIQNTNEEEFYFEGKSSLNLLFYNNGKNFEWGIDSFCPLQLDCFATKNKNYILQKLNEKLEYNKSFILELKNL